MSKAPTDTIIDAIIDDFCDRSGLRSAWSGLDDDVQGEIRTKWASIIRGVTGGATVKVEPAWHPSTIAGFAATLYPAMPLHNREEARPYTDAERAARAVAIARLIGEEARRG